MDGAIIYKAENEISLKCINNQYYIMYSTYGKDLPQSIKHLSQKTFSWPEMSAKTFRVVIMDRGKLVSIPQKNMLSLENNIMRQTNLKSRRAKPDIEIWVNRCNTNQVFFMIRTRKHASFEKTLQKGELRPDIVDVMLRLANQSGVLIDPFGGSGAIACAASQMPQFKKIYTGDINDQSVEYQKKRLKNIHKCCVSKWDAMRLPFENCSVDVVVTDPPWGEYELIDKRKFYDGFIREAKRILRANGSLVFLSSSIEEASEALNKYNIFFTYYDIRISGKDVRLFVSSNYSVAL